MPGPCAFEYIQKKFCLYDMKIIRIYALSVYLSLPQGYKKNSCSTTLSMKLILLINVKMILTFVSRINKTLFIFKAINITIFQHFNFYEQWKFNAQLN